jgi:hypothetical protein
VLASSIFSLGYVGGTACGQSPIGIVSNIPQPAPSADAFSTSLRYDSYGDLYAWDGLNIWMERAGSSVFSSVGSVASGNQADAGPITFSQNGHSLLLSNGAGGYDMSDACNGAFWTMPVSGGSAAHVAGAGVPYAYDALALPAASTIPRSGSKYIVNAGTSDYMSSSLSIFDASTGTDKVVIANGPGATTSIAINPKNNSLYVGVGYGADVGKIYSFSLSQIDSAYDSGTPIDFLSGGVLFDSKGTGSQIGAGMFFDKDGYLFAGGFGFTVFRPDGTVCYNQGSGYNDLTFDPADGEVLVMPYGESEGLLYRATSFEPARPYQTTDFSWPHDAQPYGALVGPVAGKANCPSVPEPSTVILLLAGGLAALAYRWQRTAK